MEYKLIEISKYVSKLAEVIAEVLRVDVEIIDNNFIRIAGTGRYKEKCGESIKGENFIYSKVILQGKKQVVENPGFHKICGDCTKRNSCIEKFECSNPIIVDGNVIGVISLICFSDIQKKIILEKFKEYTDFIDKISELIGAKAKENYFEMQKNIINKEMEGVINSIEDNVIIINSVGEILFLNDKFKNVIEKEFENKKNNKHNIKVEDYGERVNLYNDTQFNLIVNGKTRRVMGRVKDIDIGTGTGQISRIVIFKDLKIIHKTIYEHSQANREVFFDSIIGTSKEFESVKNKARRIVNSNASVLITGESGTGKELIARAIHCESKRKNAPFIAINCGAIPDTLLESELFGYVPGAFTGAGKNGKIGKFELANKGTIFLDEIGDMPLHLQVKILRVLQEKMVIPIGSNKPVTVDIRVISATNRNLEQMVKSKEFREDLYYRLNVIPIEIPALRNRKEDISVLVDYFLDKYCKYYGIDIPQISEKAMWYLNNYYWYGNVREMENVIEYMVNLFQDGELIDVNHLPQKIVDYEQEIDVDNELNIEKMEKTLIIKALRQFGGSTLDKQRVANALGISVSTLYRKMDLYGIKKIEQWNLA